MEDAVTDVTPDSIPITFVVRFADLPETIQASLVEKWKGRTIFGDADPFFSRISTIQGKSPPYLFMIGLLLLPMMLFMIASNPESASGSVLARAVWLAVMGFVIGAFLVGSVMAIHRHLNSPVGVFSYLHETAFMRCDHENVTVRP